MLTMHYRCVGEIESKGHTFDCREFGGLNQRFATLHPEQFLKVFGGWDLFQSKRTSNFTISSCRFAWEHSSLSPTMLEDSALFLKILDPLLKLVTCSPETRTQLANFEDFLLELLRRLEADEDERPSGHLASCWKGKHMKTRWRFKKSSNNLTDTVDVVVPCSPCPEKKSVVTS